MDQLVRCPTCGADVPVSKEAYFCDQCGTKLQVPEAVSDTEPKKVCETCGTIEAVSTVECHRCGGTKFIPIA